MADVEDLVEEAEEEGHNQWSMDKGYSADNLHLLLLPVKDLWQAMLLSLFLANQLCLELETGNLEINHAPAECRNLKLRISPREHTRILRTDNTSVPSARMK